MEAAATEMMLIFGEKATVSPFVLVKENKGPAEERVVQHASYATAFVRLPMRVFLLLDQVLICSGRSSVLYDNVLAISFLSGLASSLSTI